MVRRSLPGVPALLLLLALAACQKSTVTTDGVPPLPSSTPPSTTATSEPPSGPKPRCATQDCKTKKIIDDGCVDDAKGGRLCASCVMACPSDLK